MSAYCGRSELVVGIDSRGQLPDLGTNRRCVTHGPFHFRYRQTARIFKVDCVKSIPRIPGWWAKNSNRANCKGQFSLDNACRRPTRVPLLNIHHRAARLAWTRHHKDWRVEDWKRVAWSDESRFRKNTDGRLKIWHQAHKAVDSKCQDVSEQGVKGQHTAATNLTELWTTLANIWHVIPVESFQKRVESMPRPLAAVIKASGGSTRY
ncbi:HTH_Tnp_Tc3_2 domain-containing protein [Trichonephila clavipes]|nr:HTH_Tnp_Tc3_2 domain-containing protein [Trichonephila clavipes]